MMQTVESIVDDLTFMADTDLTTSPSFLYISMTDVDAVAKALSAYDQAFDKRKIFYGATEIGYFAPDGTQVTFAQFPEEM